MLQQKYWLAGIFCPNLSLDPRLCGDDGPDEFCHLTNGIQGGSRERIARRTSEQ